jgi:hypothetical protein
LSKKWIDRCIDNLRGLKSSVFQPNLATSTRISDEDQSILEDGESVKSYVITSLTELKSGRDDASVAAVSTAGNSYPHQGQNLLYGSPKVTSSKEKIVIPEYYIPFFSPLSDFRSGAETREAKPFVCATSLPAEQEAKLNKQNHLLQCGSRMLLFSTRFAAESVLSGEAAGLDVAHSASEVTDGKIGFADRLSVMIESVRMLNEMYEHTMLS